MKTYLRFVERLSCYLDKIAGLALTFTMLLVVTDVILRRIGLPIPGSYETVAFIGVVVIGFALPRSSWERTHVSMDILISMLTPGQAKAVLIFTKLIGIAFFLLLGIRLFFDGGDLICSGEVTQTLKLPFYPIAYGLGVCCFVECLVLAADIPRLIGGDHE